MTPPPQMMTFAESWSLIDADSVKACTRSRIGENFIIKTDGLVHKEVKHLIN